MSKNSQAMEALLREATGAEVGEALRRVDAAETNRDFNREAAASALYEQLRLLDKDALAERAGLESAKGYSRQELVAMVIRKELP